jgi:hypothetical protein
MPKIQAAVLLSWVSNLVWQHVNSGLYLDGTARFKCKLHVCLNPDSSLSFQNSKICLVESNVAGKFLLRTHKILKFCMFKLN